MTPPATVRAVWIMAEPRAFCESILYWSASLRAAIMARSPWYRADSAANRLLASETALERAASPMALSHTSATATSAWLPEPSEVKPDPPRCARADPMAAF